MFADFTFSDYKFKDLNLSSAISELNQCKVDDHGLMK